ncbi:radical SAM protein [Sulfoacidibacillus thermotolerans]|uniref:7-carboxy-7-deazaguanine synthase n=2 Tax=Sulfoacidibacillus thermotolerans TaxID=1765684 RepID=A0A2U3D6R0_SULT2|nr:radical SAM protein [Sulfoacidibacillus thermotolerans]PWI56965.1 radical SAM protein [Sulfoacidibacillus thermotolerans]
MEQGQAMRTLTLPLVEIFETVEGEGTAAGFPTIFIRLFGCPLRCSWCDTPYSYPPASAEMVLSVDEIIQRVKQFRAARICLTGGEPLLYTRPAIALLNELATLEAIVDIHVETSGAIDLAPFLREVASPKVRYILDYKLASSGETDKMQLSNLKDLRSQDELKFVIASRSDFDQACTVLTDYHVRGTPLFSPVWGALEPSELVKWMLEKGLAHVKLNLQIHKVIWDPAQRGV